METINIRILLLTAFAAGIQCTALPFGIIIETGVKSNAEVKADANVGAGPGWDMGPTLEGTAQAKVSGSWLKNAFGRLYYVDSKGEVHGVGVALGSIMGGEGVAEANAKAGTNILNTKVNKNAGLHGDASYKAGFDIHFLDKSEVLGVDGVNKGTNKHYVETTSESTQSLEDSNAVGSDSKQLEDQKQEGFLKKTWNKYIGK